MKKVPYERIVQWVAGPVSAGVGLLVAWLATKSGLVAAHQGQWQHDITEGVMFLVGSLVTYAAHHRWQKNVPFFAPSVVGGRKALQPHGVSEEVDAAGVDELH